MVLGHSQIVEMLSHLKRLLEYLLWCLLALLEFLKFKIEAPNYRRHHEAQTYVNGSGGPDPGVEHL